MLYSHKMIDVTNISSVTFILLFFLRTTDSGRLVDWEEIYGYCRRVEGDTEGPEEAADWLKGSAVNPLNCPPSF